MARISYVIGVVVILSSLIGVGWLVNSSDAQAGFSAQQATPTPMPEPEEEPQATEETVDQLDLLIPFFEDWVNSPHADRTAEAFIHWDEDDPQEVPASCARCHSTPGYRDYVGADGSAAGVVDSAHPVGTVVECAACHNDATIHLTSVTFPSGEEVTGLNDSARCMECHQGRASTDDVVTAIEAAGLTEEPDTVSEDLGFINIHYYAAAASLYGGEVRGGFQFDELHYQPKFNHVAGMDSCIDCHQPHTLEVKVEECAACHEGVTSVEDLRDVRMQGSLRDYDGDGDIEEGISHELDGLRTQLLEAIQGYAANVGDAPIAYHPSNYPYYFVDVNEDGEASDDEANYGNRYNAWTPRLLKAAYNYQTSLKDPGAFAHNAKYHIQLLYDSIANLNEVLPEPIDLSTAHRDDAGHFDPTAEAFLHFLEEEDGMTPASCAKCHNAAGLPFFLEHGVSIKQEVTSSLACSTCHVDEQNFALHEVTEVEFPSGLTVNLDDNSNLCLNCHQGRESTFSVNASIIRSGAGDDEISEALRFLNPHYFAAGATVFGGEAQGAYQFRGKVYTERNEHVRRFNTCTECHTAHELQVQVSECADCHDFTNLTDIREPEDEPIDWDGDGNVEEGIADEIATMHEQLLVAIQSYSDLIAGQPVAYAPLNYPYWYGDLNENGIADPDELIRDNRFGNWTPNLLRAAYNYQYVAKDPGAFAHNSDYILQIMYDSLEAIGGPNAVADMERP